MIRAYAETYLNDAQNNLGDMMDYAVHDCKYEPSEFFSFFLSSGIAAEFEKGNPKFIAGMSGAELASEVNSRIFGRYLAVVPSETAGKSADYWAGWALAYLQWYSNLSFKKINDVLSMQEVLRLYPTLHEADISKFVDIAVERILKSRKRNETSLARIRTARGLSQRELAQASGVTLRMIQLYEQKQNDLSKAQVATLLALSTALSCDVNDLVDAFDDKELEFSIRQADATFFGSNDVVYGFPPIADENAQILILGTFPGRESLSCGEYYADSRNKFWEILFGIFKKPNTTDYGEKCNFLSRNRLAVWDVLKCARNAAADDNIQGQEINDFHSFFETHRKIHKIIFNGKKAEQMFLAAVQVPEHISTVTVWSSSGSFARTLEQKISNWNSAINC